MVKKLAFVINGLTDLCPSMILATLLSQISETWGNSEQKSKWERMISNSGSNVENALDKSTLKK